MSRGFRRTLYALSALGALAVAAYLLMITPWFRRALERRVIAEAESLTGARVAVGEFRFNPLALQFSLHGVVLRGSEPAAAPPLFSAQTLVVGLSPAALLRRRLSLRSLECDNAELHLLMRADGSSNLPEPKLPTRGAPALNELLNLTIGRLTVLHTNIYWNDQRVPLDVSAREVAFQLRRHLLRGYVGSFSSAQITLEAPQWALPPTTLAGQFHFTRADLTVDSLVFRSAGMNGKCSIKLTPLPAPQANVSFSAAGDFPELARAARFQNIGAGTFSIEGAADYRKGEWTSQGRAQIHGLVIPSASFHPGRIDVQAGYTFDQHRLVVSNLTVAALGGTVQGTGEVLLVGPLPVFDFRTEIRNMDMAESLRTLPGLHTLSSHLPPASSIQGKLTAAWKGRFRDFKSDFDLRFTRRGNPVPPAVPVDGLARGTARLAGGLQVEFKEVRFHTPHSFVTAEGTAGESVSNLSVRLGTASFEEWRPLAQFLLQSEKPIPLQLRSQATFTGTVSGPITASNIHGDLRAGPFEYRGWAWDGLTANIGATRSSAEISSARLRSGTSELVLDASAQLVDWRFEHDARAHFAVAAQRAPIEALESAFAISYPLTGLLTGRLTLDGTVSSLAGSGELQIDQGRIYQEPFDALSTTVRVAGPEFSFDEVHIARGDARVTGQAQINPDLRKFSATLRGRNFAPADFKRLFRSDTAGVNLDEISSLVSVDVGVEMAPGRVDLHSTWEGRGVQIDAMPVGDLSGRLDWQGQEVKTQIAGQGPGGNFHLTGAVQTQGDWPLELAGDYSNFRADPWLRFFAGSKFNARMTASGALTVKGPLQNLDGLEIQSQARLLEINVADQKWSNAEPVVLTYAGRRLSAKPFHMLGPSTNLEVEGSIRIGSPPAIELTAHGESEATLLGLLDPAVHASGRTELSLSVSGSPAQPLLRGTLGVQDISLGYGDFPFRLSGLNGEIQLEGDRAAAKSLRGQIGGGPATLSGYLTFGDVPRFDVRVALEQVRVQYPTNFTSLLAGNLNLVGTTEGGQLSGDLTVRQMYASESFNVLTLLGEANAPGGAPLSLTPSPLAAKIRLNVRVNSDPEVRLETHDLRLVADIDMVLRGTVAIPVETGTVHILSGEAVMHGNRYRLERGDVAMANPFRTSPVLDLEARTRVQRYDVTLDITGPFDQMKIAYRSDPPLPTGDILSLLALGFARETGGTATTTTESARTVGASALLSQALSSQTTGRIQRLFGVSRIRIDPNVGGPANISGARVTVEQQVTHDLTLTYATNTGATQQQVVQFEWALSERLSLIGIRDQNGIFGVEFRLRRGFK